MKHAQRTSFRINPIAAAVALALATQFAGNVAQAGSGFGSGVTVTNSPVAVPTYYANSPAGPIPTYTGTGAQAVVQYRNDGSALPVTATSGTMLRKFVDPLKLFGAANPNSKGQYIPVAVPEKWVDGNGTVTGDDYYEIAAVEFTEQLHSDLPKATHLRGYVQLETPGNAATSKHIALYYPAVGAAAPVQITKSVTDPVTGVVTQVPVLAYDAPHHLGPVVNATKGTAVRVKFSNYLPVGGKLFVPVDTTITGAGPVTVIDPATKLPVTTSYTQNRAEIHLVGGQAPWISAGTPHQWVAPAGETAAYAAGIGKGASVQNVPDMADPGNGAVTLFFPNDMSARFTFYQDATSGLTRLNSYVGMEAGYVVTDPAEAALIASGAIPSAANTIPLIFEDKTFVPANIGQQDALWTDTNWGTTGDLWFPHVYEPNQDPKQASGANPVGRWDYGPLFWPLAPVSPQKAQLPSPSFTPESYMDTPLVNGTAYPTVTVEPKAYRLRLLNASNDRYLNLGFYQADTTVKAPVLDANGNPVVDASGVQQFMANTEVKMIPAAPQDAAGSPAGWDTVASVQKPLPQFPTFPWHINAEPSGPTRAWPVDGRAGGVPDPTTSGPDFVVIGNDGGFLPGAVDIPSQPVTYEQNRRSITVTNIYGYGMLLGPAERADTIVDFSAFAGKTLILYNDAPSPTPFNDPRNDYYTGNPDLTGQGGMYSTQPGYGPNTRTVMQVVVGSAVTAGTGGPLNASALASGLPAAYGASQPRPLVTESVYNPAFGTTDVDTYGRVATGSAAQPNLTFSHSGILTLNDKYVDPVSGSIGFNLVTSGGAGTGSGSGYLTPPTVVLSAPPNVPGASQATAVATINAKNQVATVNLTSPGSGYTTAPTVTFVPENTVSGVTIADPGAGYSATDVVVFTGGGANAAQQASATLTVNPSSVLSTTPVAWAGGEGYTLLPTVSFIPVAGNTPGLNAAATVTLATSTLVLGAGGVLVNTQGSGYSAPKAVVSAPQMAGTTATATPVVGFAMAPISVPAAGILPTLGGSFDVPAPTGTGTTVINFSLPQLAGGTVPQASVTVDPASGAVTGIAYTSYGSGYTAAPTFTISDNIAGIAPNVYQGTATLAAASGQIFGVNITAAGSGYTAPATITFTDTPAAGAIAGTGASATAAVVGLNAKGQSNGSPTYAPVGVVNSFAITSAGRGYTATPTVQFNNPAGAAAPAIAASATVGLATVIGAITGVTMTKLGSGYTSVPSAAVFKSDGVTPSTGTGALLNAGLIAAGVGAQAAVVTSTTSSPVVLTKAEQELWDDYGRYNSTGGVELPYTTAAIQTTVPLSYIDAPTEVIGDGETQIWKLVDNGFWSNSIHFNMANVQLINRIGWDGTVKAPASNEVGWKDTLRLNPLEDVVVAVQGKRATAPFGQPRSTRLQDPSTPANTPTAPAAPLPLVAGTLYAPGLGFLADPNVVQPSGLMASTIVPALGTAVPAGKVLLTTTTNTNVLPASPTSNYDNEFLWGTAVLGHASNDFQRPVVFNPTVTTPDVPTNLADPLGTGTLTWTDPTPSSTPLTTLANPKNEIGFTLMQAPVTNGKVSGAFTPFAQLAANSVKYAEPAALVAPNLPGYYAYQVTAYNVAGVSDPSNIVIEAPPAAPGLDAVKPLLSTNFIVPATTTSDVNLTLNWIDNAVNETNYIITKTGGPGAVLANGKVIGGTTSTLTAPPNTAAGSTLTTFNDPTALVEGAAYEYDIVARNSFGDSTPVLSGTLTAPISIPLAPTKFTATPTVATCPIDAVTTVAVPVNCKPMDVVLSWLDNSFNETSYTIDRTGGLVAFPTVTLPQALNNIGSTITYTDHTAQEGVPYTYTISAVNAVAPKGTVAVTAAATVTPTAPTVPTNVKVAPSTAVSASGTYLDTATITWSDNAYNEMTYQVYRDGNPVGSAIISAGSAGAANNPMGTATTGWLNSPVLSYTDGIIGDGTTHIWSVLAANAVGTTPSANVTATMPGIVITPPSNLVSTPNRAGSSIGLSWTDNSTNETDWLVEESVSTTGGAPGSFSNWTVPAGSPFASTTTAGMGSTVRFSRANVPTTPGYVYTFRVSARNLANKSDSHPYIYAQSSLLAPTLTAAPTLAAPTISATGRVTLNWTAVTPPTGTTISYQINVNGVTVVTNQLTYSYRPTLAALQAGVTYTVQAVATAIRTTNPTVFGTTVGPASNKVTFQATAPVAAAVPTGLAATITPATGAVTLNWTAVTATAGTTLTYLVSYTPAGGTATIVPLTRGSALALPVGVSYAVSVASVETALGLSTTSAYSAPITVDLTAAAVPGAPATLTVNATTLNWTAPAALTGTGSTNVTYTYNVQQSINGGAWTTLATAITARTLAVASPVGSNYRYQVQAMATRYGLATSAAGPYTTTAFNTLPAQSTVPVLTLTSTRNFNVAFTNTSTNITAFTIQRRLGAGTWTTIAPAPTVLVSGTAYSFKDTVTAAGSYTYRVLATSVAGSTAYVTSNAVVTP